MTRWGRSLQVGRLADNWLCRAMCCLHVVPLVWVSLVVLLVKVAQTAVIVGRVRPFGVRDVIVLSIDDA